MISPRSPHISFEPLYPDVLTAVTGGPRIHMEHLECTLGMFPRQVFLNQPSEMVLVMQSMIDKPMDVKIAIRLPTTDRKGEVAVIETPKSQIVVTLSPGEAGVLRMPVIARPPTRPGRDFPVRVAIRFRPPANARFVRPPGGGAPPTVLSVSPFKLQVLREVQYVAHRWNESTEILTVNFDLVANRLPSPQDAFKPRYETLWTHEAMKAETNKALSFVSEAQAMLNSATHTSIYPALSKVVAERFSVRGMPLHPGEANAIAKMMAYVVDVAGQREPDFVVETTRYFRQLCHALAANPALVDGERNHVVSTHAFEGILYESTLMAFRILQSRVREDLGTIEEQINYANRILTWFAGHGDGDLSYVYLPLVLCGLVANRWVKHHGMENPWNLADDLTEAMAGRIRLADGASTIVFEMLDALLEEYKRTLRLQRIDRG